MRNDVEAPAGKLRDDRLLQGRERLLRGRDRQTPREREIRDAEHASEARADLRPGGVVGQLCGETSVVVTHRPERQARARAANVPRERGRELRAVPPLQRDLVIADDHVRERHRMNFPPRLPRSPCRKKHPMSRLTAPDPASIRLRDGHGARSAGTEEGAARFAPRAHRPRGRRARRPRVRVHQVRALAPDDRARQTDRERR